MEAGFQHLIEFVSRHLGLSSQTVLNLLATVALLLFALAIKGAAAHVLSRRVPDIGRQYALKKAISYLVGFVVIILVARMWLGDTTGMAAYLGIVSAGLAIALQDPLTNLAGWIFLTTRKPFAVGDRIEIGGHRGDVIDVRLFQFTIIEIGNWVDADQSTGRLIHLPNGWIFKHPQANYTEGFNFIWNEVPVMVTFESNWAAAKELLLEIARRHSAIQSEHAANQVRKAARKYMIFFQHLTPIVWTRVADSGTTLTVRYLCDPRRRRSSETAIWEDILRAFAERDDLDFAYPTTRYYDNVVEGKARARARPEERGREGP